MQAEVPAYNRGDRQLMRDAMTTSNRNVPDNGCATASNGSARRWVGEKPSIRSRKAKIEDHDGQARPRQSPATTTKGKLAAEKSRQPYTATFTATFKSP